MKRIIGLALLVILLALPARAVAQTGPVKYFSAASTNSTLVVGRKALLTTVVAVNTTGTVYYLKLYNKVTAPTCGTDVPKWTLPVPANGSINVPGSVSVLFPLGLGFCLTSGVADNDTGNAATGVVINLGVTAAP